MAPYGETLPTLRLRDHWGVGGAWGIGPGRWWAPRHRDTGGAPARARSRPMPPVSPDPPPVSPHLLGVRSCAPTTFDQGPQGPESGGLGRLPLVLFPG